MENSLYGKTDTRRDFEQDEIINLDLARTFRNQQKNIDYDVTDIKYQRRCLESSRLRLQ